MGAKAYQLIGKIEAYLTFTSMTKREKVIAIEKVMKEYYELRGWKFGGDKCDE